MEKVPENRNSGTISGTIFSVKRKFPESCPGITDRYGIPEYRSGNFRFPEQLVP